MALILRRTTQESNVTCNLSITYIEPWAGASMAKTRPIWEADWKESRFIKKYVNQNPTASLFLNFIFTLKSLKTILVFLVYSSTRQTQSSNIGEEHVEDSTGNLFCQNHVFPPFSVCVRARVYVYFSYCAKWTSKLGMQYLFKAHTFGDMYVWMNVYVLLCRPIDLWVARDPQHDW